LARLSDWVQETPSLRHQSPASLELGPTRTLVYSTAGVSKCTVRECATCARKWGVEMATVLKCVRSFADWNRSGCGTIGEEGRRRKRESAQDALDDSDKSPCFQWSQRPWKFQSDESSPQVLLCVGWDVMAHRLLPYHLHHSRFGGTLNQPPHACVPLSLSD
jgi:hypothetical protein